MQEKELTGKIIKGIAGFYYVDVVGSGVFECKAKGIFRKEKKKPLVGDEAKITILDEEARKGNLIQILPRKNELIRPAVANIDQALIIFAMEDPKPNYMLLDVFLVMMEKQNVPVTICMNKKDLGSEKEIREFMDAYGSAGYRICCISAKEKDGIDQIRDILKGKTTAVAGPSGVGKSTITNLVQTDINMETGEISKKLGRGRHTTRHSQLIPIDHDTYIMDTPGFSSLEVEFMKKEELKDYFPEFRVYENGCRFLGCSHTHEPGCAVKEAVKGASEEALQLTKTGFNGDKISELRYKNYVGLYEELKEREKRRY